MTGHADVTYEDNAFAASLNLRDQFSKLIYSPAHLKAMIEAGISFVNDRALAGSLAAMKLNDPALSTFIVNPLHPHRPQVLDSLLVKVMYTIEGFFRQHSQINLP